MDCALFISVKRIEAWLGCNWAIYGCRVLCLKELKTSIKTLADDDSEFFGQTQEKPLPLWRI